MLVDRVIPTLEGGGSLEHPAVSPKGARGPMQVMPETARQPGHGIKPSDGTPQDDVRVGRELAAALLDKYDGDTSKMLAAYNWGEGHLDAAIAKHGNSWLDHAPAETQTMSIRAWL
jgi:soluble lytic murein transglycosylase